MTTAKITDARIEDLRALNERYEEMREKKRMSRRDSRRSRRSWGGDARITGTAEGL